MTYDAGVCCFCGAVDSREKVEGAYFCRHCYDELYLLGRLQSYAKKFRNMELGIRTEEDAAIQGRGHPGPKCTPVNRRCKYD